MARIGAESSEVFHGGKKLTVDEVHPKNKVFVMEKNEQTSNALKALQREKSQHQFQDSEFLILTKRSKPHHRDPCSNIVPQREEVNDLRKKEKFLAVQDSQRVTWTSRNSCDV